MTQTEMQSTFVGELDATMSAFLLDKVNSFVKWDLVRFFHQNAHAADTAENIARYTGRDVETVQAGLDGLVESGVLQRKTSRKQVIYQLVKDASVRDMVSTFVRACDDRLFRVAAIHQMVRGMH
jgi:predicted transcriptional regulator